MGIRLWGTCKNVLEGGGTADAAQIKGVSEGDATLKDLIAWEPACKNSQGL